MILGVLIACHSRVLVWVQERLDDVNDTETVSSISLHFVLETGTEKGTSTDCSWNRNSKGYVNRGNLKPELKRVPTKCVMWKGYVNRLDFKPKLKRVRQRTGLETETEKGRYTSTDWTWYRNWNGDVNRRTVNCWRTVDSDEIPWRRTAFPFDCWRLLIDGWLFQATSGQLWNTLATNARLTVDGY